MTDITTHQASRRRLLIALAITCSFMVIQVSWRLLFEFALLYLLMLGICLFITVLYSSRLLPQAWRYISRKTLMMATSGAELTGGLINGILYLSISLIILYEGGERYLHHSDGHDLQINSYLMSVISAIGFLFHGADSMGAIQRAQSKH